MAKYAFLMLGVCYSIGGFVVGIMTDIVLEALTVSVFGLVFIGIYFILAKIETKR